MWAISTDKLLMGYISEIGPIDPQIRIISPQGVTTFVPAQSYINGVAQVNSMLQQGIAPRIAMGLVQKIEPPILDVASNIINFSRNLAFNWLSNHMLRGDPKKAKEIADALSDNRRWLSHGKRIGIKEAKDLGLKVTRIKKDSKLWKLLWEYYSRVQIMLNSTGNAKLFETNSMGIKFQASLRRRQQQQPQPQSSPQSERAKE